MSGPSKPWEGLARRPLSNGYVDELGYPQRAGAAPGQQPPPPLPPRRPAQQTSNYFNGGGYTGYGGGYGGGYGTGYGGYNSPFGSQFGSSYGVGVPYSPYRSPFESRFGFGAEDGQSPFQSVESVVRAISSLSMMMESTYQSMFMSFRAVMGVAENMDRLRRVVLDLFGSVAVVKSVVWFFKKILYVMGLISNNPSRERLWEAAVAEVTSSVAPEASRRTWPLVAFFGLMIGGPYLLYKLVPPPAAEWDPKQDGVQCVALYDFDTNQRGELPFSRGEVLVRKRSSQGGWALAMKKNGQKGFVPADRLKPISSFQRKPQSQPAARVFQPHQAATTPVNVPRALAEPVPVVDFAPVVEPSPEVSSEPEAQ